MVCTLFVASGASACGGDATETLVINQLMQRTSADRSELAQWKQWEAKLVSCRNALEKKATAENFENFLLLGAVGYWTNAAATREFMAGEVLLHYQRAPDTFWEILGKHTFLVDSSCYYLGRYFSHEKNDEKGMAVFFNETLSLAYQSLGVGEASLCVSHWK